MKIARSDLVNDDCPDRSISETRLIDGPVLHFPDMHNITLHFDCNSSFPLSPEYSRSMFKCNEDGVEKFGFFEDDNSVPSGVLDPYEESYCESRVEVPISEIRLTEVRGNKTELLTALSQGILVVYNGSYEYCLACENSNGICWSGTSLEEPTCLCRDGIYPYLCGFHDKGKSGKVGMKIGIGIGGAALCFVAFCTILYAYCRRQKGYSSGNELDLQGSLNHSGCIGEQSSVD
nr:LEAF RUST 10 DISEASE-RESISTANCE LOCUS RECEPTOR-LIKE PROTEIN KINASE-like 1.2 isoform X1 [Ipomoea batatas]